MKHNRGAHLGSEPLKFCYPLWPHLLDNAAKPIAILAALFIFAPAACAQTNFFPVLDCKNRAYTNATIETVTPATVTIFWDGGGERISITNLPPELLTRYHYDPLAAQAYLDAQAAKKAALRERDNLEFAAMARAQGTLGPAQKIRIVKIISEIYLQIEAEGKVTNAYIPNLPPGILASFRELTQTKVDSARLQAQVAQDQYAANQSVPNTAAGAAYSRAQKAAARAQKNTASAARAAAADAAAALAKVNSHLKELESRTTFIACPTDFINSEGTRQWKYEAAATAGLTPK